MKLKDILKLTPIGQLQYLDKLEFDVKALKADLKDFQTGLLEAVDKYAEALADSRNPLLVKTFGDEVIQDDITRTSNMLELYQEYVAMTVREIMYRESLIRQIKKNLNIK